LVSQKSSAVLWWIIAAIGIALGAIVWRTGLILLSNVYFAEGSDPLDWTIGLVILGAAIFFTVSAYQAYRKYYARSRSASPSSRDQLEKENKH